MSLGGRLILFGYLSLAPEPLAGNVEEVILALALWLIFEGRLGISYFGMLRLFIFMELLFRKLKDISFAVLLYWW